jgi:polyhydroxyalkanoate synthesis repressor PhaR
MTEISQTRLIKRYPNRRLYDVQASRYVNLADIRKLVVDGHEIKVLLEKTNEDQTKNVLMQIFLELEMGGTPIFSNQSLKNLIMVNSTLSNDLTQNYLTKCFGFLQIGPK